MVARPPRERATAEPRFRDSVSVFFPAFNDARSLPELIERTVKSLERLVADYEIIVVDDGSTDDTPQVLACLQRVYPFLRIITHRRNLGYGAALRAGFLAATKTYVFYTDGDGQYDPRELALLLEAAAPDVCLVNGYKTARSDSWHRVAIGWLYNRFARWVFRIRLRDLDCDFRLIRRSELDLTQLCSTGGTICIELVRNLEVGGSRVVEVPVTHLPRLHGRSQFFRLRSLASTFLQLWSVFFNLVLSPALLGLGSAPEPPSANPFPFSRRTAVSIGLAIACLSFIAYGRALSLPFISDDYLQVQLGRDYGPMEKWPALAQDALYRCRATSIVLTNWIEAATGLNAFYYNLTGLLLHIANGLLIFALGFWKPIGWRVSALAACYFAVSQRHSEAVIWFSAVPELLVFFFVLASFGFWVRWLQSERLRLDLYGAALLSYVLALLSKESAVALVPLCALAVVFTRHRILNRLLALLPFGAIAAGYFAMDWFARETHLHFNDGTFSLNAPFGEVLLRSAFGLLWIWGTLALASAAAKFIRLRPSLVALSVAWIVISLLPYSFLTYMPRVPSRHTYLASLGLSWLIAEALISVRWSRFSLRRQWLAPAVASVILIHDCGYIWTVLHNRYTLRARPTEMLVEQAVQTSTDIYANCFPYSVVTAEYAIMVAAPGKNVHFLVGPEAARHPDARDFCNAVTEGKRY